MKLGLEILAHRQTRLWLGTFFESWISTSEGVVRRSLGRDEYHLDLVIGAEACLAATGRTHICQADLEAAEMGKNQAPSAVMVPVRAERGAVIVWGFRTNRFLSLTDLTGGATGRLHRSESDTVDFSLSHPDLAPQEVGSGRYMFDMTSLIWHDSTSPQDGRPSRG